MIFICEFKDDVTDINIEPLEAISNVTLAQAHDPDQGTKLTLNWNSNPDVKVVIVFESQPLGFYVERESPGDTLFLNIPSGQVFNVSFKAVYPNGNSSVKWEKSINTEINPGDKFEDALKDLTVYTESDENGKGKSFLKWQHTLNYGLERYACSIDFTNFLVLFIFFLSVCLLFLGMLSKLRRKKDIIPLSILRKVKHIHLLLNLILRDVSTWLGKKLFFHRHMHSMSV